MGVEQKPGDGLPDLEKVFAGQEDAVMAIKAVKAMLMAVGKGLYSSEKLNTYINEGNAAEFLNGPTELLDGQSPIAVLRLQSAIDRGRIAELEPPRKSSSPIGEGSSFLHHKTRRDPTAGETFHGEQLPFGADTVGRKADVSSLSPSTTFVHLTQQEVITKDTIARILTVCPNLRVLQIPSSFGRLIHSGVRQMLEERGVELREGRVHDSVHYDEAPRGAGKLNDKTRVFEAMRLNPQKMSTFSTMLELEVEEAMVVQKYFDKSKKSGDSLRIIAADLGLPYHLVQRKFDTFMCWLGMPYRDKAIVSAARNLGPRVLRLEEAKSKQHNLTQLKLEFSVDGQLAPEGLPVQRIEMWSQIVKVMKKNPTEFENLKTKHPDWYQALMIYFHLDSSAGSVSKFASRKTVSKEAVYQWKNRALEFLKIVEK